MHYDYTPKDVERFWSKVDKSGGPDACWNWTAYKGRKGYGRIGWGGPGLPKLSHRVAYEIAFGEFPEEQQVLHRCDNPSCVNPSHLFLGTNRDNVNDRQRKGRNNPQRGERNGNHKLTDMQVDEIRQRYSNGETRFELAKVFGVHHTQIWNIVKRRQRV